MTHTYEETRKLAYDLGWDMTIYDTHDGQDEIEFESYSPLGENLILNFTVSDEDELALAVRDYYDNFDIDEHVELWVEAKLSGANGIPRITDLVHDADEIDKMLDELAEALLDARARQEAAKYQN